MEYTYQYAQRLGERCYKEKTARGEDPYLPVLETLLAGTGPLSEEPLGLREIPLERVEGTISDGRRQAFAANFMPLMEPSTEFAAKYQSLITAHETEGIRDPVKVCEYLHRYYVTEGNKRVSVLKLFGAVTVSAEVTRILPAPSEDPAVRLYYEFLAFYRIVPADYLIFSKPGDYERFLALAGWSAEHTPDESDLRQLRSGFIRFRLAYRSLGGDKLKGLTEADAWLIWQEIYGREKTANAVPDEIRKDLEKIWGEFELRDSGESVRLVTDAQAERKPSLLEKIFVPEKVLRIAFLYEKTPETLSWTYGHELGRQHIMDVFGDKIITNVYDSLEAGNIEEKIAAAVRDGADVIFVTSSRFLTACLKAAVTYPNVKILCAALNFPHRYLRTYYARIYEAKFVSGAIAAALSETGKIGYVATCPVLANILNLNAFAGGVKMIRPHAKVHVVWTDEIGADPRLTFWNEGISLISGRELLAPVEEYHREFGLYRYTADHRLENLAMTLWNWGEIYRRLIESIRSGNWEEIDKKSGHRALNYFWGFDAGAIDLLIGKNVPESVAYLARHLVSAVKNGELTPFYGIADAQDAGADPVVRAVRILTALQEKDWQLENIVGHIPTLGELRPEVRPLAEAQGVENLHIPAAPSGPAYSPSEAFPAPITTF